MEPNDSNKNTDQPHASPPCPHENNVVTDPTTARVVLMFLRDLVDEQTLHTKNLDGYSCPMTKCSFSFKEPLELIQHLLTCPELGKGEFDCRKCFCWHQFPTDEKEWSEWTGWKSTVAGHQRKRSLGSKMKDTLTETFALRRRGSVKQSSVGGSSIDMAHSQLPIFDTPGVGAGTTSSSNSTLSMESESTSTAVSSSRSLQMTDDSLMQSKSSDWDESFEHQKASARKLSSRCNDDVRALDFSPLGNSTGLDNSVLSFGNQANHDLFDAREDELSFTRAISDTTPVTNHTQVYPHATANSNFWTTNTEALAQPLSTMEPYLSVPVYGLLPQLRDRSSGASIPGTGEATPLLDPGPDMSMTTSQLPMITPDMSRSRSLLPSAFPYPTEGKGSSILSYTPRELITPAVSSGDGPQTWFPGMQQQLETSDLFDMSSINNHMILQLSQSVVKNNHQSQKKHELGNPITETADLDMDRPETPRSRRQSQLDDHNFSQFSQAATVIPRQETLYTQEPIENSLFPEAEFETATNTTKPGSSIVSFSSSGTPHDIPYTPASISGMPTPQQDVCFSAMGDDIDPEDLFCDQCAWKPQGVRENLRGYLRKHKNVHKGIRHHCDMPGCKKSFSRLDNLKTHRREKHGIDEPTQPPKPFVKSSTDFQNLPQHGFLPIKRTISMTSDTNERINDGMSIVSPRGISSAQYKHLSHDLHHQYHPHHHHQQHVAHVLRSAEAIAKAQSRQIQAQTHTQAQAQVQAHVIAQVRVQQERQQREEGQTRPKFASLQLQVPQQAVPLQQPAEILPETPRPDSKRNKDSLDLGSYRGVSSQHAALWPAMQF